MSLFQRVMARACFLGIGAGGWTLLITLLHPVQGAPILGFFFGILWWEVALMIWPAPGNLPLFESAVAWRAPIVTEPDLTYTGYQPVGIPTTQKEGRA